MVFSPAWGGFSPIPLVQQGALRDWLETVRGYRKGVPVRGGATATVPLTPRGIAVALASAGLMAAYARIVGVAPERVDTKRLFEDIQQFLNSQQGVSPQPRREGTGGRPGIPGPPLEKGEHDYEPVEAFLKWIERRRYRRGSYYTPNVRGTR